MNRRSAPEGDSRNESLTRTIENYHPVSGQRCCLTHRASIHYPMGSRQLEFCGVSITELPPGVQSERWPAVIPNLRHMGRWLGLAVALQVSACSPGPPPKYRSFFRLPLNEQEDALRRYPIEERIELFVWGSKRLEHPILYLVRPLAEGGQLAVAPLMERLRQSSDPIIQAQLMLVFQVMECHYYHVGGDSSAMLELRRIAESMPEGPASRRAMLSLRSIQGEGRCYGQRRQWADTVR